MRHVGRLAYSHVTAALFGVGCGVLAVILHDTCVAVGYIGYQHYTNAWNGAFVCLAICTPLAAVMHFACSVRGWVSAAVTRSAAPGGLGSEPRK
jgi:hypothetical protein